MAINPTAVTSRRSLIAGVLGGTAAVVAASVAGAQRVFAVGDDGSPIVVGGLYAAANTTTRIVNNANNETVFRAGSNQGGTGVEAFSSSGPGVSASSTYGTGVASWSDTATAVHADTFGPTGRAVHALSHHLTGVTYGTLSEAWSPAGVAVLGNNYATTGHSQGVQGTSDSPAGYASTGWARKSGTALIGASGPTFPLGSVPVKTGVYGYSQAGRGGVFQGKTAQVRLVPSTASTHPLSGALGDLFLDKNKRLWFCKGGRIWNRIV